MRQKVTLSTSSYNISQRGDILSASSLKIRTIDLLPGNLARGIRDIDISQNLISKIDNLKQFPYLQSLNISHNKISNGNEILKLLQSTRLIKVHVCGNPFLQVPLDEQVLQFLIEKETDIQILNGENLNRIRQLQEGQLKVVFLQNYIKKINCHQQIMSKHFSRTNSQKRSLLSEQSTNRLILNKVMPQFYQIIDDPRLRNKLKRQAISIKRKDQVTFEDAMSRKKQKQEQQLNSLIKDILLLVEEQDEQKYQSNQRQDQEVNWQETVQRDQQDQMRQTVVDLNYLALRKKLSRSRQKLNSLKNSKLSKSIGSQEMNRSQTNKSAKIQTNSMNRINLITPKNKASTKIIQLQKSPESRIESQSSNFYSFNKVPQTRPINRTPEVVRKIPQNKQIFWKTQKIQIQKQLHQKIFPKPQMRVQIKDQTKSQRVDTTKTIPPQFTPKAQTQKSDIHNETKKFDHKIYINQAFQTQKLSPKPYNSIKDILQRPEQQHANHSIQLSNFLNTTNMDPNELYEQYYAHLTKYNPSFALLYSDVQTLSPQQKLVLILALAKDHKSKTIQLFIQREKTKNLKHYSHQNALSYQKQKQELLNKLQEWKQNFSLSKQFGQQTQKQNGRLSALVKIISQDIKAAKQQSQIFLQQSTKKDGQIRFLQIQVKNKNKQIAHLDKCQQIAQVIKMNNNKARKKQFLKILQKRAHQYFKIKKWKQRRELIHKKKLINLCWSIMKRHLLTQVLVKMKSTQKTQQILKQYFNAWKNQKDLSKINQQKSLRIQKIIKKNRIKQLRKIVSLISSGKKQRKLHIFWADHQLLKSTFYKLMKRTKILKSQTSQKFNQSINHHKNYILRLIILKIKQQVKQTNKKIAKAKKVIQKQQKISFYENWRRLQRDFLLFLQTERKYQAISRIVKLQRQNKNKYYMITALKNQNQELKNKKNGVFLQRKRHQLRKFAINCQNKIKNGQMKYKNEILRKKVVFNLVFKKFLSHQKLLQKIRNFFIKSLKKDRKVEVTLQRKSQNVQNKLKINRVRSVFYSLIRNMFSRKVFQLQVQQRLQQDQTKLLMQKMRTLEQMQIQAIKSQYAKQMQHYHENEMKKDIEYRSTIMQYTNDNRELQDAVLLLKNQLDELRDRENAFFKQKQLIQQQVRIAEQGKLQLNTMNQTLRMQLSNLSAKYERILELYSQAMYQIQKLKPQGQKQKQKQKDRDKTVEKQKRTGVVKISQYANYRNNRAS